MRPLGMLAVIEAGQMGWRVIVAAEENAVAGAGTLLSPERLREIRAFLRDTASAPCLFAYDGLLLSNVLLALSHFISCSHPRSH